MKLWTNGVFHTLENETKTYRSCVTHHGHILSFNQDDYKAYDEIIDLNGAHVYPGFVDAHLHILGYGEKLNQVSLKNVGNKQEAIHLITTYVHQGYITFYGLEGDYIDKHDLNLISKDKPIIIKYHDYHAYIVNDYVLKTCQLANENNTLTLEDMIKVNKRFLSYTRHDLTQLINQAIQSLYQYGITGGHSDDLHYFNGYDETLHAFKDSLKQYPFRTQLLIHHLELDKHIQANDPFLNIDQFLQLGPIKVFYDGTLSSKTALINDNYKNSHSNGSREHTIKNFIKLVKKARSFNRPLAIHVIGDQALDELLDILKTYPPTQGQFDRLIHASCISKKALAQLQDMAITIDIQPQFIDSDFPKSFNLFSKNPDYIYPFKSLLNKGITLCGSSDAPVETPNPLLGMYHAMHRNGLNAFKDNDLEKLSAYEALKLYTTYANIPTYHHNNRGYLKVGYIADFTIFKKDLLTIDVKNYLTLKPYMTVINEQIVYKKD